MALIKRKPMPPAAPHESIWASIAVGVRYVYHHQVLLASMALDLFAVLFGGAVALLPIFAERYSARGTGRARAAGGGAVGGCAGQHAVGHAPPAGA